MRASFLALAETMEEKLASYGAATLMGIVAQTPIGAAFSAMNTLNDFLTDAGQDEVMSFARGQIGSLTRQLPFKFKGIPLLNRIERTFGTPVRKRRHRAGWQNTDWAMSRQDWLTNKWRHDWRSQPRHPAGGPQYWSGTWMPGRLSAPVPTATHVGKGKSRTSRKKRRIARYRRYGRIAARSYKFGEQ